MAETFRIHAHVYVIQVIEAILNLKCVAGLSSLLHIEELNTQVKPAINTREKPPALEHGASAHVSTKYNKPYLNTTLCLCVWRNPAKVIWCNISISKLSTKEQNCKVAK